jgi:hypothetical protein
MSAWRAETLEAVTISIILSSAQVLLLVPHWLSTTFFSQMCLIPIGLF